MKALTILAITVVLAACGDDARAPAQPAKAEVVSVKKSDHEYSLKDGYDYGYERAVSDEDAAKGKVASSLLMVRYAGARDGKFQAYIKDRATIAAFECANPCEFLKTMTFYDGDLMRTERTRAVEGSVGWSVMSDAINGKLSPWIGTRNGKKFNIWFDEKKGVQYFPVSEG